MATDDPWALPGAGQDSAASAAQAAARPAQAPAAPHEAFDKAGAGIVVQRPRRFTSDPLLRMACGLLIGSALATVWYFFTHVASDPPQFEYVSEFARVGFSLVLTLAVAVLLLLARTQEVAKGAVVALGLMLLAGDFVRLRPSVLDAREGRSVHWSLDAGLVLFVAAGVLVAIRIPRGPRRRDRQSHADRVAAVFCGLLGAALWSVAALLDTVRGTARDGLGAPVTTAGCCGWAHSNDWDRAVYLATDVAVLLLVLLAATGRSRPRCLGLMLGTTLALTDGLLNVTVQILAPLASAYGTSRVDQAARAGIELTIRPLMGYWLAVLTVVVLTVTAALRYALAPRRAPYPQLRRRPPRRQP